MHVKSGLLIFLFFTMMAVTNLISYRWGYTSGRTKETDNHLRFDLIANVTNYNELSEGQPEKVKHNLAILINGDLMAFDFYKKTDPNYQERSAIDSLYLEKARAIQKETKPDAYAIPVVPQKPQ